ncbi:hypothetical protein HRI_000015700 [Hibiscus trionum]|uniref:Uncharacterized protein n=1 Tax=Hibiscus trionum TaxID=183268 RepID=A0A9W7GRA2_HIBTR|nr:hypothetical protein HRI_000015700 [Hibiscus trionum]
MPCALQQIHLDSEKVSEVGQANWSKNSLQLISSRRSSEVSGISSFHLRNIGQRCAIVTFPTVESDGKWRIVALPLQCFDHTNHFGSRNQVNMNDLHLVSSASIGAFMVDGRKTEKGPRPATTYPAKPFRGRSFSGSNVQHQFRNKTFANIGTKFNEVSKNSSYHSSITCNDSSAIMSEEFNATSPSAMFINSSDEDKSKKRNSQKRGKHKKKQLCDVGSTESEVYSQYTGGSSASEICGNNDINFGIVVSYAASPEVSPSDSLLNVIDFADSSNGAVTSPGSPNISTSDIDEVDISEFAVPSQVQKFSREQHHINNSEMDSEDQQLSRCRGDKERKHLSHMNSLEGLHQKDFSDVHDSLVLDSVSVGSNCEDSASSVSLEPFNKNILEVCQSELPDSGTKKGSSYCQNSLCSTIETHDYLEESKHGVARSSLHGQIVASSKRGKQFKSVPVSSSTYRPGYIGNLYSRRGTENSHSVWQRVQKNAVEKCNTELKKTCPVCPEFDVSLKDAPVLKRNPNAANVTTLSTTNDKKSKGKVPRKLKRKVSSASKEEKNSLSWKESHPNKVDCARVGTLKSESIDNFQAGPSGIEPCDTVYGTPFVLNNLCIENQNSILRTSFVPLDQPNLHEVQSPVYLSNLMVNGVAQTEKGISLAENGKQSHNLGSVLQKWIPIRIKDCGLKTSVRSANLSLEHTNGPDAEDWTSKNTFEEKANPCSENVSMNSGALCRTGKDPRHEISSLKDGNHIQKLRNLNACVNENENKNKNKHSVANFFIDDETKEQDLSAATADLNKIAKALNDAYRAQMASEAVQMATGCPIAEFERLLHFCSPVICRSYSSVGCHTCLLDQVPSALLCRHETPNIALGCLWLWYEKHGSYGLEIRAEDHKNPKRLGIDQLPFRAYFVPYLSAVQLFKNSKNSSTQNNTRISSPGVSEDSDTCSTSRNSATFGHHPIFSVLVPQPRTAEPSNQLQVNDVVRSEPPAVSPEDVLSVKSVDITQSDCLELAFEYFESEQPQQRRALYEKIQDLVRDDVSPRCNMYGDPVYLNSINIHDLHPQSWYSVAWYPIYKIPDGNFRAAFLTYHSLGHLVRRSSKFDHPRVEVDACVVSPVVGLQSYNAQGECWFQPRHSTANDTCENQGLSPSIILKERLRTLQETASLMARAVVTKGNKTSVNRHPDYEFFFSRQQ